ncbi:MAG: PQQ-dependent sugar dehydrogenase [Candidatus Latescibacteria bacterium]|nr:PQQ-dependent sugar dehydrogenase [Candidatus Latescibacterota bacterium]
MKSLIGSLSGLMLSVCVCTASETEQHYSPQELKAAKEKLREHNRLWTFETGAILGREWTSRAPEDAELRALYARQLHGQLDGHREIQEQADAILEREPDNPWGLYAQALAFLGGDWQYSEGAAESSLRAWMRQPQPEFAATHLLSLRFRNPEAGMAFRDSVDAATLQHPEVLHARAELEYWAHYALENPAYADTSLATLATLRARWPDHVSGYFSAAQQLHRSNKPQEALPLIEEAIRLSPGSAHVRYLHWQILNETDQLPADEQRAAIEASITAYRQAVPETARGLALLTTAYRNVLGDEEQAAAFEAKLLALAPAGRHASRLHQEKFQQEYQRLQSELERIGRKDAPEYQTQLRLICDAAYRFLEKPLYDDSFRERPYRALLSALSAMNPVPAEELAEAVRGLIQYEEQLNPYLTCSALILMADHTPYAEEAAEIARGLIQAVLDKAEEEAWEERPDYYLGFVHDALGWALYKAGRVEEGRNEIEQALEFWERNTRAHYHLGQIFEHMATEAEAADTWLDKAADAYIAGLEVRSWEPNPCQAALAALYERRHGSREGFDKYLATERGEDAPSQIRLTPKIDLHLEPTPIEGLPDRTLNLPPGFKVKLFSDQVDKARFMAWDHQGVLHVANMKPRRGNTWSPAAGRQSTVLALPDKDGDGRADTVYKAADDLRWPHSIAFYQGALFVADDDAIYRLEDRDADGFYEERTVFAEVPGIMGRAYEHVTHTLVFDESNDKLYFHVGAGCDICREDDPERSAIIQMNTDGTGRRIYASGLRNAIGLTLHPITGELWGANTGHDREGRDLPPEWITPLRDGGFYGWPLAYADRVWTDFSIRTYRRSIFPLTRADSLLVANMEPPAVLVPAHLALMALHFYTHDQFPSQYKHAAFVACRAGALGNDPGYKVMVLFAEPDGSNARVADFLTGFRLDSDEDTDRGLLSGFFSFFNSGNVWGKPVGLITDEAGHLYLTSDEITQAIFRIEASPKILNPERAPRY